MPRRPGISRYLSSAGTPLPQGQGALAFLSAHIPEEADSIQTFGELVRDLKEHDWRILCDIDSGTPAVFGVQNEKEFLEKFGIDILRLDDGYSTEQLEKLIRELPVALNASTIPENEKKRLLTLNPDLLFVHNFYPKEDTGLDIDTFLAFSKGVPPENLAVFIPGDEELRGPLYEGLVTLEEDRGRKPYVAYARFSEMGVGQILVADPKLSALQQELIERAQDGAWPLPCTLTKPELYEQVFTIRTDSPKSMARLQESRQYGKGGESICLQNNGCTRRPGDICQDNRLFGRYSGEITIIKDPLPARERINTIGKIDPEYADLIRYIRNGSRIRFVPAEKYREKGKETA